MCGFRRDLCKTGNASWLAVAAGLLLTLIVANPGLVRADSCPEPNDSASTACDIEPGIPITGTIESPEDVDAYRFSIVGSRTVARLELIQLPADYDLYLADPDGNLAGQSVREGMADELIQLALAPGTYFAYIRSDPARPVNPDRAYTFQLSLAQPAGTAPRSSDVPPCALNDRFTPFSLQTGRPFRDLLAARPSSASQARFLGAWQTENGRLVVFATNRLQEVWTTMGPGEDAQAYYTYELLDGPMLRWGVGSGSVRTLEPREDGTLYLLVGSETILAWKDSSWTRCGV